MDKCSDYNKFNVLCQSCNYPNYISCSKEKPIKLSQITASQYLYIEKGKYSDPVIMEKNDFINSSYFLDKESVNVFIAVPEVTNFVLYDWIEWLGEENYEDWVGIVYEEIMDNPITDKFILLVNKIFKNHPTYYPGKPVEIDIEPPKGGYGSDSIKELCNKCRYNNVFWKNSGCNLKNGMEPCHFESKEK